MSFLEDFKNIDDTMLYPPINHISILPSQSNTHFVVAPYTDHREIYLPPPTQKGMKFLFTIGDATYAFELQFTSSGYLFTGTIIRSMSNPIIGTTITSSDNRNWIVFSEDAVVGDFIQMIADGTSWLVTACSNATVVNGIEAITV